MPTRWVYLSSFSQGFQLLPLSHLCAPDNTKILNVTNHNVTDQALQTYFNSAQRQRLFELRKHVAREQTIKIFVSCRNVTKNTNNVLSLLGIDTVDIIRCNSYLFRIISSFSSEEHSEHLKKFFLSNKIRLDFSTLNICPRLKRPKLRLEVPQIWQTLFLPACGKTSALKIV